LVPLVLAAMTGACAARLYVPPTGAGEPFPEAATVWNTLTARCSTAATFVAEVTIEGWTGASKQRIPRVPFHTALTKHNDVYLEVPGVFGPSWVEMAGHADQSVLLLPRDKRVLRASTRDIVDALTGLRWDAVDLLNVLTGCVVAPGPASRGIRYGDQVDLELGNGSHAWIRQRDGAWQLIAASRDGLLIEYRAWVGAYPSELRVSSSAPNALPLQVRFSVAQHNVNTTLESDIFAPKVPPNFIAMTLAELRSNRPAGEGKDRR